MKLKKQLKKFRNLMSAEARERENYREELKRLLRKMKLKERELSERALVEPDAEERERLMRKIDMLHAQRRKGIRALRNPDSAEL